jgi:2,3-bisphosphoglycerate-independent phosphoglycerate mutase
MGEVKKNKSTLHVMGLVSDGGVHSQLTHLFALIDMAGNLGIDSMKIHVILDGRDTPPDSGLGYVSQLMDYLKDKPHASIATICGRYYAMDRDTRWDRTEIAYKLYTEGVGIHESDPLAAIKTAYEKGETDEFVKPVILDPKNGIIKDRDGFIFFNFRADRARQITRAFNEKEFKGFSRAVIPSLSAYVCMTLYDETFGLSIAFGPVRLTDILGDVVSRKGLKQLRIAETEKYAHVTYFFNGGEETAFPNEDRCLVPSPRDAATYDLKPEMSANQVADELVKRIEETDYHMIIVNFANMDMVGHTGVIKAAITAVETVDACVGRVIAAFRKKGGNIIVTADHGNSEQMVDDKGGPHTAHTLNPVPLILVADDYKNKPLKEGALCDIAPTLLDLMGIEKPEAMTGSSLIG